ncbi:MAG: hypothetical protein LBL69_01860, partial [Zoogloeaceae bacterium]|nr:hypothetical protein [Zoogloeaceae bacterium]
MFALLLRAVRPRALRHAPYRPWRRLAGFGVVLWSLWWFYATWQHELDHLVVDTQQQVRLLAAATENNAAQAMEAMLLARMSAEYLLANLENHGSAPNQQIDTAVARALSPFIQAMRKEQWTAGWSYFLSTTGMVWPYPPDDEANQSRTSRHSRFYSPPPETLFTLAGPERNPERKLFWMSTPVVPGDQSLHPILVAPLYDGKGHFHGVLRQDFTLSPLSSAVRTIREVGALYVVDLQRQTLLAPDEAGIGDKLALAAGQTEEAPRIPAGLSAFFPRDLRERIDTWLADNSNVREFVCFPEWHYRVCGRKLTRTSNAPLSALFLVYDMRVLSLAALTRMPIQISMLLLVFALLALLSWTQRLQDRLTQDAAHFHRLVDYSDSAFFGWQVDERRIEATLRLDQALGYPPRACPLRDARWQAHVPPGDKKSLIRAVAVFLRSRKPQLKLEFRARARNGQWRTFLLSAQVSQWKMREQGRRRAERLTGTIVDISEQKRAENDIRRAKKTAEELNRNKSRFLAAASHDLRQPLQALRLFISVLERSNLDEAQKKVARNLSLSAETLGDLLDALLDISRLDAGAILPQPRVIEVYEIFLRIEREFSALAVAKNLRFLLHLPPEELTFSTDPALFMALMRNLISNALRYTEQGGILIGLRQRPGRLVFQVWDTGIGIEPEKLPHIYEEFYQAGNPQRDRQQGLGLGLSIVLRMAQLFGYELSCRSRP